MATVIDGIQTAEHQDNRKPREGHSNVVATHYNQIEEVGINRRKESRIIKMRSFNNWLKSMLLGE